MSNSSHKKNIKKTKKDSKISSLMRFHFLQILYFEKITIKEAAIRFGIHYSSGKAIAREGKLNSMFRKFEELKKNKMDSLTHCTYQSISLRQKQSDSLQESLSKSHSASTILFEDKKVIKPVSKNIMIVSTIGENAFKKSSNCQHYERTYISSE